MSVEWDEEQVLTFQDNITDFLDRTRSNVTVILLARHDSATGAVATECRAHSMDFRQERRKASRSNLFL
jgi:hypothetical protein